MLVRVSTMLMRVIPVLVDMIFMLVHVSTMFGHAGTIPQAVRRGDGLRLLQRRAPHSDLLIGRMP